MSESITDLCKEYVKGMDPVDRILIGNIFVSSIILGTSVFVGTKREYGEEKWLMGKRTAAVSGTSSAISFLLFIGYHLPKL